jgi:predicted RNA-binding protein YlxR (DUF448 family)
LVRFVRHGDGVALDPGQALPGRGGYCCSDEACIEKGLRRGGLARTLRTTLREAESTRLVAEAVEYLRERNAKGFTVGDGT